MPSDTDGDPSPPPGTDARPALAPRLLARALAHRADRIPPVGRPSVPRALVAVTRRAGGRAGLRAAVRQEPRHGVARGTRPRCRRQRTERDRHRGILRQPRDSPPGKRKRTATFVTPPARSRFSRAMRSRSRPGHGPARRALRPCSARGTAARHARAVLRDAGGAAAARRLRAADRIRIPAGNEGRAAVLGRDRGDRAALQSADSRCANSSGSTCSPRARSSPSSGYRRCTRSRTLCSAYEQRTGQGGPLRRRRESGRKLVAVGDGVHGHAGAAGVERAHGHRAFGLRRVAAERVRLVARRAQVPRPRDVLAGRDDRALRRRLHRPARPAANALDRLRAAHDRLRALQPARLARHALCDPRDPGTRAARREHDDLRDPDLGLVLQPARARDRHRAGRHQPRQHHSLAGQRADDRAVRLAAGVPDRSRAADRAAGVHPRSSCAIRRGTSAPCAHGLDAVRAAATCASRGFR